MTDVAFLLFLEPASEEEEAKQSRSTRLLDWAIKTFQETPPMMHCEILLTPRHSEQHLLHFATYIGRQSGWQMGRDANEAYYLRENAGRWRAVPVFATDATKRIRHECELERGVPYSLAKYITSTYPFRSFARFIGSSRREPAHCATLTARILKNALGLESPVHQHYNYYSPSSLYNDARDDVATKTLGWKTTTPETKTAELIDKILRGAETSETIADLGDDGCGEAVRALTLRVCSEMQGGDTASRSVAERQLATALLRWTVLRQSSDD